MNLENIAIQIYKMFPWIGHCFVEDNEIIIEEEYNMSEDEKKFR